MPVLAGIRREYDRGFKLDEAKLRKLVDVIKQHATKLGYDVWLKFHLGRADDSFLDTSNIDDVLVENNTGKQAIDHLHIELHRGGEPETTHLTDDHGPRPIAFVGFSHKSRTPILQAVMEDRREWCYLLSDELDTQIRRSLHGRQATLGRSRILDVLGISVILAAVVLVSFRVILAGQPELSHEAIAAMSPDERSIKTLDTLVQSGRRAWLFAPILALGMITTLLVVELRPVSRLVRWLQRSVFYWGDMATQYDNYERMVGRVKWGLIVAFIVSLAGSLVAAGVIGVP